MDLTSLFSLEGRTAVVTGGSRGIGLMIAEGLVRAGARVYISSRKADVCNAAAEKLGSLGQCFSLPEDVGSAEGCRRLADAVSSREKELHVLINNAGTAWGASLETYPEDGWDKVMATNLKAPFFLVQALLPLLRAAASPKRPARVINVGSVEGIRPPFWENYAYPASKAGLHMLTRDLARKLAPSNVTVNAVAPGLFHTTMTDFAFQDDAVRSQIETHIPLGRPGAASDMAGVAIFLSSDAGSYLTGAVIPVDGGVAYT